MSGGLTTGTDFIKEAARGFFADNYSNPAMTFSTEIDPRLKYIPSIQFRMPTHLTVVVEVSETVYPAILSMRRTDIEDLQYPISVYCACPEEAYLQNQSDARQLIAHGFGLVTVSQDGIVQRRHAPIPLMQRISEEEFKNEIKALNPQIKRRVILAFERYKHSPPSGVADVAEILEGFVLQAGREAHKKTWINANAAKPGATAATLNAMLAAQQFANATAAVGYVRGFIAETRNTSAHYPKNKAQAIKKYRECKHSFINGIKIASSFRKSMKGCGLSGSLPMS